MMSQIMIDSFQWPYLKGFDCIAACDCSSIPFVQVVASHCLGHASVAVPLRNTNCTISFVLDLTTRKARESAPCLPIRMQPIRYTAKSSGKCFRILFKLCNNLTNQSF